MSSVGIGNRARPLSRTLWTPDDCVRNLPARTALGLTLILLADQIAVGVAVAAVVVATVVVAVSAISGGAGCRGSYGCGTDRRSAIRIPTAPSSATIGRPTVGHA